MNTIYLPSLVACVMSGPVWGDSVFAPQRSDEKRTEKNNCRIQGEPFPEISVSLGSGVLLKGMSVWAYNHKMREETADCAS